MAERSLHIAALALAAVPRLIVTGAAGYSYGTRGDFDAALLRLADGELVIARSPRSEAAAREQRADIRADSALTAGVRKLLPFQVPKLLGSLDGEDGRVMVTSFLPGEKISRLRLASGTELTRDIGRAIAAVHALPRGFADASELPVVDAGRARELTGRSIDRAAQTGRLPAAIERRWRDAVEDASLWQFTPCVIHGSLSPARLVTNGIVVTGVLGWGDARIGDPARDMHWLRRQDEPVAAEVLAEYARTRGASVDRQLRRRASLYAELEIARWLVHGDLSADERVLTDAENMLMGLLDRIRQDETGPVVHETLPVLDLAGARLLLGDAPGEDGEEPRVQDGIVHGDETADEHPDDLAEHDLDHADEDDLSDGTPPEALPRP